MSERSEQKDASILAWLSCRVGGKQVSAQQELPATRAEILENIARFGIAPDRLPELSVTVRDTVIDALAGRLPRYPNLDELNYLAARIEEMDGYEQEVFGAAIEANLFCGSMTELINLTHNLDCFDLYPGDFSDHEFGGIMAEMHANEYAEVLKRLRTSDHPQEKAFVAYVERLEASLDLVRYGHLAREADNGVLTGNGYLLLPDDPLPERYSGPGDIPVEQLVTARPETRKPSLLGALKAAKAESRAADAARPDAPEKKAPSGPEL